MLLHWRKMWSWKPNQLGPNQLWEQYWSSSHHWFCSLFGFFQQSLGLNYCPQFSNHAFKSFKKRGIWFSYYRCCIDFWLFHKYDIVFQWIPCPIHPSPLPNNKYSNAWSNAVFDFWKNLRNMKQHFSLKQHCTVW